MRLGWTRAATVSLQLLAAILILGAHSGPAGAHSVLIESSPKDKEVLSRAPVEVVLRFSAKIEKPLTRLSLTAGNGRVIPLPAAPQKAGSDAPDRLVIPLPSLGPGEYVLRYTVLATDGHATSGILRFSVVGGP